MLLANLILTPNNCPFPILLFVNVKITKCAKDCQRGAGGSFALIQIYHEMSARSQGVLVPIVRTVLSYILKVGVPPA